MQNQKENKFFAFKLAQQKTVDAGKQPAWKVREGVAVAACSGPDATENYREGRNGGSDNGVYC